jgi:hypothetical protein
MELQQEVRRAQSSNLINAQNNYVISNLRQIDVQQQAPQAGSQYLNNDASVAGLQWDKLEKAQQVAVAKVAPLRVNLPTRGVRYSFGQVLQTELRKPMTIRLLAENTKAPSWASRIGLSLLGFGVLWVIVGGLNRRQSAQL